VLASFATLFAKAINSIYLQFKAIGSKGLCIVLLEGVLALNYLSSYYFTSFLKLLIGLVLAPLGIINSIK
jgi:hypothetical protein